MKYLSLRFDTDNEITVVGKKMPEDLVFTLSGAIQYYEQSLCRGDFSKKFTKVEQPRVHKLIEFLNSIQEEIWKGQEDE